MKIEQVQRGDTIIEGRGRTVEVRKVETHACSSNGTHINDRFCWPRGSDVDVRLGKHEAIDLDQVVQAI